MDANYPAKSLFKLTGTSLAAALVVFFAACGGGGGGDNPPVTQGVSLSGRLSVPTNVMTDSDINDVESSFIRNNPYTSAQQAPNPVNIGGYVNVPGSGSPGLSQMAGDRDDYFSISLVAGQTIQLTIADLDAADLDLYLYDSQGALVDASTGTSRYESLTVPSNGSYLVNVYAYNGASNYLLSVGLTPTSTQTPRSVRLTDEFVPGELLARFESATDLQAQRRLDSMLEDFERIDVTGIENLSLLRLPDAQFLNNRRDFSYMQITEAQQRKLDTLLAMKSLRQQDGVVYAEPNFILKPLLTPNDQHYSYQWHYPLINLPETWDITTGDANVIVAVIDTGVLSNHPDLSGQFVGGYDFISDSERARDGDGIDNNPEDNGDLARQTSSSFHGSHVSGTVATNTNNNRGVAGIAWNIKVMPIRVLGVGGGTDQDIIQGILYSAGLQNDSGTLPTNAAHIINMSLGGSNYSQARQDAITAARNAGVIVIAASGNNNSTAPSYPAAMDGVVSVGAVDMNRNRAHYSNYGSTLDLVAPGGDTRGDTNGDSYPDGVLSCGGDDSGGSVNYIYNFNQGTSMASPHVAGVAALMKSVYPAMTPAIFDDMIASGEMTVDLGTTGRDDEFGHGMIDALKAVQAAQRRAGGPPPPTQPGLKVTPSSLNFSDQQQTAKLLIEQIESSLGTVQITENVAWLALTPDQVDGEGYGSYTVSVDRSGLSPATYSADIGITAGTVTKTVRVLMQVRNSAVTGDGGILYLLLINKATQNPEHQVMVDTQGGGANYSFSNIPAGEYYLAAGSDMDMDNLICDAGEVCGAYTTVAQPSLISVGSSNISGLDFNIAYDGATPASNQTNGLGALPLNRPGSKQQ